MSFPTLEKRIRALEAISLRQRVDRPSDCRSVPRVNLNSGATPWLGELEALKQEATLVTEQAKTRGDPRITLASIRVRCSILELAAKLSGDLDERSPTNIVQVNIDPETARRIAQTYLARHNPPELESK
jgi:hypothetical protein